MNSLKQDKSNLIGSEKDIKALAKKDNAKILVVSDSHGNYHTLQHILQKKGETCDALVYCGDGTADVASCLKKAIEDEEFAKNIPPVISIVEGNGDSDMYPFSNPAYSKNKKTPVYIEYSIPITQTLEAAGHKIFSTHGHRFCLSDFDSKYSSFETLENAAKKEGADIICYGHTHIALAQETPSALILNPGSCTRPRGGQLPSFAIINLIKNISYYSYAFFEVTQSGDFPLYDPSL